MSEHSETLGRHEARGVCGAAVLARAIGGDALGRLQQVLSASRLPQSGLAAAVQRGIEVSREGGASALVGFFGDLEALGRALVGDPVILELIEEWRLALRERPSLSVERLAFGHLSRFVSSQAGLDGRPPVAGGGSVAKPRPERSAPAPAPVPEELRAGGSLGARSASTPEIEVPERAPVELAMSLPDSGSAGERGVMVGEFNRQFAADLAAHSGEELRLTLPS